MPDGSAAPSPALTQRPADLAFLARALADENRLRILLALASGKRSVSAVVEAVELSQPLVSHHLRELKRALLVTVERKGPFVYYGLSSPEILDLLHRLDTLTGKLLANRSSY